MTSRPLFMSVAESTVILRPMLQLGCFRASATLTVFSFSTGQSRKAPPEAVRMILRRPFSGKPCMHWKMAECSESASSESTTLHQIQSVLTVLVQHVVLKLQRVATCPHAVLLGARCSTGMCNTFRLNRPCEQLSSLWQWQQLRHTHTGELKSKWGSVYWQQRLMYSEGQGERMVYKVTTAMPDMLVEISTVP